jgi:hypothetical protein
MRERGIIFNTEMVKAILDGRKTQTRRVIKPQPRLCDKTGFNWKGYAYGLGIDRDGTDRNFTKYCPYGKVGDRLYVRETFQAFHAYVGINEICSKNEFDRQICTLEYKATNKANWQGKWRPSIHMPKWASRIKLEITNIRVERVQDISLYDINREGVDIIHGWDSSDVIIAKWIELWNSINENRGFGWDTNCWVWVIEFNSKRK